MTIAHVDCRAAGEGELTASVIAEDANCVAPVAVRKNEEGLYDVTYSVPKPDTYILDIKYDNEHIPGSPFTVKGQSKVDPTQVGKSSFSVFHWFLCKLFFLYRTSKMCMKLVFLKYFSILSLKCS